jgi:hypothetical protein
VVNNSPARNRQSPSEADATSASLRAGARLE